MPTQQSSGRNARSRTRGRWLAIPLVFGVVAAVGRTYADRPSPPPAPAPAPAHRPAPAAVKDGDLTPGAATATAIARLVVPRQARVLAFTEEREAAARVFVRKNRPELDPLLDRLPATIRRSISASSATCFGPASCSPPCGTRTRSTADWR